MKLLYRAAYAKGYWDCFRKQPDALLILITGITLGLLMMFCMAVIY